MPERCCLYCEVPLIDKRPDAMYCDELCGRAYRNERVHMSREAEAYWEGVRRAGTRRRRAVRDRGGAA